MIDASPADAEAIEFWGDDIVVSRVGRGRPRIHDAGFVLRCRTASAVGTATHTLAPFESKRVEVERALARVAPRDW